MIQPLSGVSARAARLRGSLAGAGVRPRRVAGVSAHGRRTHSAHEKRALPPPEGSPSQLYGHQRPYRRRAADRGRS